ncbi:MAG: toast rack family protein, partial [Candidatus Aminicenantes bacterium]|nr:toast rack family protein [Candidatus Aminicenantes bacterium]
MTTRRFIIAFSCAALILAVATACVKVGERHEINKSIPLDNAQSLEVDLRMSAGELQLGGGAAGLMDGRFQTNIERWKPEIQYNLDGSRGRLTIEQRRNAGFSENSGQRRRVRIMPAAQFLGVDSGGHEQAIDAAVAGALKVGA